MIVVLAGLSFIAFLPDFSVKLFASFCIILSHELPIKRCWLTALVFSTTLWGINSSMV